MTKAEWNDCPDPAPMLEWLRHSGTASDRKLRLFACACCRQIWRLLKEERSRKAVETSELYADGKVPGKRLAAAEKEANRVAEEMAFEASVSMRLAKWAVRDAAMAAAMVAARLLEAAETAGVIRSAVTYTPDRPKDQCHLLRDIFSKAFRAAPPIDPARLVWNDNLVLRMATAIYEERSLPSGHLDPARLAVLADALEEAGATDEEVLAHLRCPGPHVRGCFAVDALLGKA